MKLDPLFLSRLQWSWVIGWHILLPAFTVGLASYIAVLEGRFFFCGDRIWLRISRFWTRIFAVSFAMGVVTWIIMPFQFGANWSRFSDAVANRRLRSRRRHPLRLHARAGAKASDEYDRSGVGRKRDVVDPRRPLAALDIPARLRDHSAFAQGAVLGAYIQGFAVTGREFSGESWDWLTPFSVLTGIALMAGYALLGAGWLIIETEGSLQAWARRAGRVALTAVLAAILVVSLWTAFSDADIARRWLSWPHIKSLEWRPQTLTVAETVLELLTKWLDRCHNPNPPKLRRAGPKKSRRYFRGTGFRVFARRKNVSSSAA